MSRKGSGSALPASERETGVVKWFNDAKGFGFITRDVGGKDCFVHHSQIISDGFRSLKEGQRVEYAVETADRGPEAVQVRALAD